MRPTKSTTSSSANALPSESIGTAWRTLAKRADGAAPTRLRQAFQRAQLRKTRLDRTIALAQLVVFGVRNRRRVVLIIAAVVPGDLGREPRMLGLGLLFSQFVDRNLRCLFRGHLRTSTLGMPRRDELCPPSLTLSSRGIARNLAAN